MKQIDLAMIQYAQNFDEIMPINSRDTAVQAWDFLIEPYAQKSGFKTTGANYATGNAPYLKCPSDTVDRQPNPGRDNNPRSYSLPTGTEGNTGVNDSWPWKGGVGVAPNRYFPGRTLAEFAAPAETLMVVEAPLYMNMIGSPFDSAVFCPSGSSVGYNRNQDGFTAAASPNSGIYPTGKKRLSFRWLELPVFRWSRQIPEARSDSEISRQNLSFHQQRGMVYHGTYQSSRRNVDDSSRRLSDVSPL